MNNDQPNPLTGAADARTQERQEHLLAAPTVELPKGGGAIRGIGEAFKVDAPTATASLSVPLAAPPGRHGFGPALSLSYSSGGANGPFGMGWSLDAPRIQRRTDKQLPTYTEADTFMLSGAELVPELDEEGSVRTVRVGQSAVFWRVTRYLRRREGAFDRIEHWVRDDGQASYWRVHGRDNVVRIYGRDPSARTADPSAPHRIFAWHLEEVRDDRGQVVWLSYTAEDRVGVSLSQPSEAYRDRHGGVAYTYLTRVCYGNRTEGLADPTQAPDSEWAFELRFDYGQLDEAGDTVRTWSVRRDPFSDFRSGFDRRCYRLCRRVLALHRFSSLGASPVVTRSTQLNYTSHPAYTLLQQVVHQGHRDGETLVQPPLTLSYTQPSPAGSVETLHLPTGLRPESGQWVDLDGEGLPGLLTEQAGGWFYARNEGGGRLAAPRRLQHRPSQALQERGARLLDLDGNGRRELAQLVGPVAGSTERSEGQDDWDRFVPFVHRATVDPDDPNVRMIDLTGDGRADIVLTGDQVLHVWTSAGRQGYTGPMRVPRPSDERDGPTMVFAQEGEAVFLADMTGDGLTDLVRIRRTSVQYWPNRGYGRFGSLVALQLDSPFASVDSFDPARLTLADVDGTGTTDLLYQGERGVWLWRNWAGNRLAARERLGDVPPTATLSVQDVFGEGLPALVWSPPPRPGQATPVYARRLHSAGKPWLLCAQDNGLGAVTTVEYTPSTQFYVEDRAAGTPWVGRVPFPVHCVSRVRTTDRITGHTTTQVYRYRHGHYDGHERQFAGFARVDQWDTEVVPRSGPGTAPTFPRHDQPPVHAITWTHTGLYTRQASLLQTIAAEGYQHANVPSLPEPELPFLLGRPSDQVRDLHRALGGQTLRAEVYAEDRSEQAADPYTVTGTAPVVRLLQPATATHPAVTHVLPGPSVTVTLDRNPADPRIAYNLPLEVDRYGTVLRSAAIGEPRRDDAPDRLPEQAERTVVVSEQHVVHQGEATPLGDTSTPFRLAVPVGSTTWEVSGYTGPATASHTNAAWRRASERGFHADPTPATLEKRQLTQTQVRYYDDDLVDALPQGSVGQTATVYTTRALAFRQTELADLLAAATVDPSQHGYTAGDEGPSDDRWWLTAGRVSSFGAFRTPLAVTDPFGQTTTVAFDADLLLPESVTNALGHTVSAVNDYVALAPVQLADANGHVSEVQLDALSRPTATAVRSADGTEGDTLADPTTRLVYETTRYAEQGLPARVTVEQRETHGDPGTAWQRAVTYTDGRGHELVTKVRAEDDPVTTAPRWVGNGRVVLNNKGAPIKQYEPYFSATEDFDAEEGFAGVSDVFTYDPVGRVVEVEHANGTVSRTTTTPWHSVAADAGDTVLGTRWYTERQALAVTDPDYIAAQQSAAYADTPTVTHADALGRAVRVVADNGLDDNDDPVRYETAITLDLQGNVRRVTDPRGIAVQQARYDRLGRALEVVSPDSGTTRTFPAADDQPVASWSADDLQLEHSYDVLRRPLTLTVTEGVAPSATTRVVRAQQYGEDPAAPAGGNFTGRLWRSWDASGRDEVSAYDFKGQPVSTHRRFLAAPDTPVDWSTLTDTALQADDYTSATVTDALGRPTQTRHPGAGGPSAPALQTYSYNARGLLTAVSAAPRGGTPSAVIASVTYDAKGQRQQVQRANGVHTTYTYEPDTFRLSTLTTTRSSDSVVLQDLSYTYDAAGNIVRKRDDAQSTVYFANNAVDATEVYTYDAVGRLIEGTGRERIANGPMGPADPVAFTPVPASNDPQAVRRYSQRFTYDASGNLTEQDHWATSAHSWTRTLSYASDSNRLVSTQQGSDPAVSYSYNGRGGTTSLPHLHNVASNVQRDHTNRMTGATVSASVQASYGRDGSGQRVRKRVVDSTGAGQVEERLYFGSAEVYRKWIGSTLDTERWTLHVSDGSGRVDLIDAATVESGSASTTTEHRLPLMDHLGNSVTEVDSSGSVISAEAYYPYGSCAWWLGSTQAEVKRRRYRYTGKERDEETGLQDHGARMYAAWLCRWCSADPAWFVDGANRWAYVSGRPIGSVDPTGRSTLRAWAANVKGTAVGAANSVVQMGRGIGAVASHVWTNTGVAIDALVNEPEKALVGAAAVPEYVGIAVDHLAASAAADPVGALQTVGEMTGASSVLRLTHPELTGDSPLVPILQGDEETARALGEQRGHDIAVVGSAVAAEGVGVALGSLGRGARVVGEVVEAAAETGSHSTPAVRIAGELAEAGGEVVGAGVRTGVDDLIPTPLGMVDDAAEVPTGVVVASGGGRTLPMSVVRTVQKGEKIADIINEGKALTFTTGNEHALVTLASGERAIVSGGPGGISFSEGQVSRIFGHTHPTSAPPSAADFQALRELGQTQQTVLHGGQVTKVRP